MSVIGIYEHAKILIVPRMGNSSISPGGSCKMPQPHPTWMAQTVTFSASEICMQTPRPECLLAPRARASQGGGPHGWSPSIHAMGRGPGPWLRKLQWGNGDAGPTSAHTRERVQRQSAICIAASGFRRTEKLWAGFWTPSSVLVGGWFFLCFAEEIGLELGSPCFPKLGKILIKIFFLPHQLFFNACIWWKAAESYPVC